MLIFNKLNVLARYLVKKESKRINKMIDTKQILHVNASSLDKILTKGLVLVDFWAEWCAPCRMQNPILEELAEQIGDKCLIVKLNVDDNRQIASKYGIRSIPTLMLFNKGKIERQFVGVQPKQTLLTAINNLI